ncbi:hypothetical protein ACERII_16120 [Evansella sp. AB-rgal1]|uniref:hypothetical protein n=1 Tax=Evansella sp. AB-rgal1 TaxID=3242696 RepID=UPI00359E4F45
MTNNKSPLDYDRYATAHLSPDLLQRISSLEEDLRNATEKEIVLIAYEESEHNAT